MQQDDIVWNILGESFCSFRLRGPYDGEKDNTEFVKYCKHPYNLTGKCEFRYCPLANSKYCTVVNEDKKVFLMLKAPERVHFPRRAWEKIELPPTKDLGECKAEMDRHIQYFPEAMKDASNIRLMKIDAMLKRIDRMNRQGLEEMIPVKTKELQREKNREKHAVKSANLEMNIEKEILARALEGEYGDHEILNLDRQRFHERVQEFSEDPLNESMDSELTGDIVGGMDLEDTGDLLGERERRPKKTKISTRLKFLKTMNKKIKRKRLELETESENKTSIKV